MEIQSNINYYYPIDGIFIRQVKTEESGVFEAFHAQEEKWKLLTDQKFITNIFLRGRIISYDKFQTLFNERINRS